MLKNVRRMGPAGSDVASKGVNGALGDPARAGWERGAGIDGAFQQQNVHFSTKYENEHSLQAPVKCRPLLALEIPSHPIPTRNLTVGEQQARAVANACSLRESQPAVIWGKHDVVENPTPA